MDETTPAVARQVERRVMPSERGELQVEFFHQDGGEPFICGVIGHATVETLATIEAECIAEMADLFDKGDGSYLFQATWFSGQYGEHGQCELAPCWEVLLLAFEEADDGEA